MSLSPPHIHRGWTLADLSGPPDDGQRYELVDGGLVVTPPATQRRSTSRPWVVDCGPTGTDLA